LSVEKCPYCSRPGRTTYHYPEGVECPRRKGDNLTFVGLFEAPVVPDHPLVKAVKDVWAMNPGYDPRSPDEN